MNKLLMLIVVVLFGLASMSGPTMAAGVGSGSFWTIANQESCLEPTSVVGKAPAFKPCSKKINGHAISCQHIAAILPLPVEGIFDRSSAIFVQRHKDMVPIPGTERHFRPPQAG